MKNTSVDFVNAYHLFIDAEWDGKAVDVEDTNDKQPKRDTAETKEWKTADDACDDDLPTAQPKLRIRLSDGKVRELQSMSSTYFYVDGKPISAEEFLQRLFDTIKLPELLGSEAALRKVWANPLTRRDLLIKLEGAGCYKDDLLKLQELIDAKDSDLFDVLEYIAYAQPPVSRAARVETNKQNIYYLLNDKQREFVSFVLRNYVNEGVDELDVGKLSTVLTAKYGSINAAQRELGGVQDIQRTFVDFQRHLYAA